MGQSFRVDDLTEGMIRFLDGNELRRAVGFTLGWRVMPYTHVVEREDGTQIDEEDRFRLLAPNGATRHSRCRDEAAAWMGLPDWIYDDALLTNLLRECADHLANRISLSVPAVRERARSKYYASVSFGSANLPDVEEPGESAGEAVARAFLTGMKRRERLNDALEAQRNG